MPIVQLPIVRQYTISNFIEWDQAGGLILQAEFQRNEVWTPAARSYLMDTILRGYPVPKIYLRSTVDVETQKSVREVVDGQQRLSAILAFAKGKLRITHLGSFKGFTYETLGEELKKQFLDYPLTVEQLVIADNAAVLDVFARLNTYTVLLNPAEKRHARYNGDFKTSIRMMSGKWDNLMENIFTLRQRLRMKDDSLMAEMFGIVMEGVRDGSQFTIEKLYRKHDDEQAPSKPREEAVATINSVLEFFQSHLEEHCMSTPLMRTLMRPPHFLMLFAALAHCGHDIPIGALDKLPESPKKFPKCDEQVVKNLRELAVAIKQEPEQSGTLHEFWNQSKTATTQMPSRKIRFKEFFRALDGYE